MGAKQVRMSEFDKSEVSFIGNSKKKGFFGKKRRFAQKFVRSQQDVIFGTECFK